jgi:glucose/arabinose dehydrogenase
LLCVPALICFSVQAQKLIPQSVKLKSGETFALNLPEGFHIRVAAEGLKRVRFFAPSPDGRLFVTDMHDKTDNKRGAVYILDKFDPQTGTFGAVIPYLKNLRNPNSAAFLTDAKGHIWFYLALTDKLVRYRFTPGETAPASQPETLATFPDYGLNYKYGGWHLTRTIAPAPNGKIYLSVGSSCNACVEKEAVRASVIEMNPDGSGQRRFATGLRNVVDLKWVGNQFLATNMGADHLGDNKPDDSFFKLQNGRDYGWPYCYQYAGRIYADYKFNRKAGCAKVAKAFVGFPAHSAPLGFDFFAAAENSLLQDVYLVALHGPTNAETLPGRGYRIARVSKQGRAQDFINGFRVKTEVHGRPCGILRVGPDEFFFTDDHKGVIYYVSRKP